MKVYCFPADDTGCGYYRLIWPAQELQARGHNVEVVHNAREFLQAEVIGARMDRGQMVGGQVLRVHVPSDADVIVLQRPLMRYLSQSVEVLRSQGLTVVVEMDDDLSSIHPKHFAYPKFDPRRNTEINWEWAERGCDTATMVTVSTPSLLHRYARTTPGIVIPNVVPDSMLTIPHTDSIAVGWGGNLFTHPDDPRVIGDALSRLYVTAGQQLTVVGPGTAEDLAPEFGLKPRQVRMVPATAMLDYAGTIAGEIGVGIAPLQHSAFNNAKSYLKIMEYSALGIPWVASGLDEYRAFFADSGGGLIAESPKAWHAALRKLTRNKVLRADLAAAGKAAVADRHVISKTAGRWWDAWESAYRLQNAGVAVV